MTENAILIFAVAVAGVAIGFIQYYRAQHAASEARYHDLMTRSLIESAEAERARVDARLTREQFNLIMSRPVIVQPTNEQIDILARAIVGLLPVAKQEYVN